MCSVCGDTPCDWLIYGEGVKGQFQLLYFQEVKDAKEVKVDCDGNKVINNIMRRHLYQTFTYMKHGHLGKGIRTPTSVCVKKEIRALFPDENKEYVNFPAE